MIAEGERAVATWAWPFKAACTLYNRNVSFISGISDVKTFEQLTTSLYYVYEVRHGCFLLVIC